MSAVTDWLRGHRALTAITAAVLVSIVVLSAVTAGSAVHAGDLDPQNPSGNGAQAVARVLEDHGVQVTVVRRAAGLERAAVDGDTTVVVTSPENLGRTTARRLGVRTLRAGALVLAAPGRTLVSALRLPVTPEVPRAGTRVRADCRDALLSGLELEVPATTAYRVEDTTVTGCFAGGRRNPALVVRVDSDTSTYVVGADGLFTNARVDRADNAAAALRLLGQHDRLLWYVPDARDVVAGDTGSLWAELPDGLVPGVLLVGLAVVATMLWRGRRLGALVVEPLPVVVKAVESTQGRGRLYRRVHDREHAAGILRESAARRIVARLRLPRDTPPDRLVQALAAATGSDPRAVHDVLVTRPVPDDRSLTRLAADLAALEREVHRT
ncbi:MAG: DUF4350 domain-containing protein [Nocardioidaceae bacterium]